MHWLKMWGFFPPLFLPLYKCLKHSKIKNVLCFSYTASWQNICRVVMLRKEIHPFRRRKPITHYCQSLHPSLKKRKKSGKKRGWEYHGKILIIQSILLIRWTFQHSSTRPIIKPSPQPFCISFPSSCKKSSSTQWHILWCFGKRSKPPKLMIQHRMRRWQTHNTITLMGPLFW